MLDEHGGRRGMRRLRDGAGFGPRGRSRLGSRPVAQAPREAIDAIVSAPSSRPPCGHRGQEPVDRPHALRAERGEGFPSGLQHEARDDRGRLDATGRTPASAPRSKRPDDSTPRPILGDVYLSAAGTRTSRSLRARRPAAAFERWPTPWRRRHPAHRGSRDRPRGGLHRRPPRLRLTWRTSPGLRRRGSRPLVRGQPGRGHAEAGRAGRRAGRAGRGAGHRMRDRCLVGHDGGGVAAPERRHLPARDEIALDREPGSNQIRSPAACPWRRWDASLAVTDPARCARRPSAACSRRRASG